MTCRFSVKNYVKPIFPLVCRFLSLFLVFMQIFTVNNFLAADEEKWGTLEDGEVHVFYCSHQDIGWEDSYYNCRQKRNDLIIKPVLDWISLDSNYKYCVEYSRILMDFLDLNHTYKPTVIAHTKTGNIEWGATYNCGYESLFSSEALVRQTYLGRKWIKNYLGDGCDTHCAWNVDAPVRALQAPQIYKKAGIKYMMASRYKKGFFKWSSPNAHEGTDDYSMLVFSDGKYDYPWVYFPRTETGDTFSNGLFVPYGYFKKQPNETGSTRDPVPGDIDYIPEYINDYWKDVDTYNGTWYAWNDYYSGKNLSDIMLVMYMTDMGIPRQFMGSLEVQGESYLLSEYDASMTGGDPSLILSTAGQAMAAVETAANNQGVGTTFYD
ncbi:MAG: hypothetical protein P9M03_11525, partial [Candidatus Theseobacter exili]|nr:hypothetical protein [Candidatus Theseobacter exili]